MTMSKMPGMTETQMERMMQEAIDSLHPKHYESSSTPLGQSENQAMQPSSPESQAEPEQQQPPEEEQQQQPQEPEESSQPEQQPEVSTVRLQGYSYVFLYSISWKSNEFS